MIKKVKNFIKYKLISFLGLDYLEERLLKEDKKLRLEIQNLKSINQKVIEENNLLMKQFNVSADINYYGNHSWAVISIQGKPEYIKFVNLSDKDMRDVHMFLKQFERTNRAIDSPMLFFKN